MKNKFFGKNVILIVIFLVVIVGIFVLFKGTYTQNTDIEYTREELQDMIVSTALSYLHNNRYTDYDQTAMDVTLRDANSREIIVPNTFNWRNPRVSPEEASRTNIFSIDCSSFVTIVYKYSLGYDSLSFDDFWRFNEGLSYYEFSGDKLEQKFVQDVETMLTRFEKIGKGMGSYFTGMAANSFGLNNENNVINHEKIFKVDINNVDNNTLYIDKLNTKIGTFLYEVEFNDDGVYDYFERNQVIDVYNKITESGFLEPGDLISYQSNVESPSGHVMLYVGNILGEPGFIHSTGNDYEKEDNGTWNIGDDLYSVRYDTMETLQYRFNNKPVFMISVIRPINKYLSSEAKDREKAPVDAGNDKMILKSDNISINGNERSVFKWIRTEQYMTKVASAISKDLSEVVDDVTVNMSKYNSVNEGERITYNLELENKSVAGYCTGRLGGNYSTEEECENNTTNRKWENLGTERDFDKINVYATIPENAEYVSCNLECSREGNTLIWKNITLNSKELKKISYTVTVTGGDKIINDGMEIKIGDNTLKMGELVSNVNPTTNELTVKKLKQSINKFQEGINNRNIEYGSSSKTDAYISKTEDINGEKFTSFGFVKNIYYDAFGINLAEITGTKVRDAIFNKSEQFNIEENGVKYNVFAKKTEDEIANLTGDAAKINKMLVKGFYGGRYLKGNDNYDRPGRLRITDLEVGDIIVYYVSTTSKGPASDSATYMYLGNSGMSDSATAAENDKMGVFVRFAKENDDSVFKIIDSTTSVTAHQFFNELWSKNLFVVLRPSQLYGTTVKYNNSTISGVRASFEYGTYKNLRDVKGSKVFTTTLDYNNAEYNCTDCKIIFSGGNYFNGWYLEPERTKQVTNGMELLNSGTHMLYADWEREEFLLPQARVNEDVIVGWYKDESLTKIVGYANTSHKIADGKNEDGANETLYAKWGNEVIYSQIDKCENVEDKLYCKINENTNVYDFKNSIGVKPGYDSNVNYKNVNGNKVVNTGGITRILRSWDSSNDEIIRYTNVVRGDTDGDGAVSVSDVSKMFQYYRGTNEELIKDISIMAGDVVKNDGEIKLTDVAKLFQYANGTIDSLG